MPNWIDDKLATDPYLEHAREIIGPHLVHEAPLELDRKENTDLLVLGREVRVAVRIRANRYEARYGDEFTLRSGRPSGAKTELQKVLDGFGDYFLYGFRSKYEPGRLSSWVLGDLDVFRRWYAEHEDAGTPMQNRQGPVDDRTWFRAFRIDELPDDFVIERRCLVAA